MFAFVLYDQEQDRWLIARDHLGIIPLYTGRDADGTLHVASEMKALVPVCTQVEVFPPGHLWTSGEPAPRRWWSRDWQSWEGVAGCTTDRAALTAALDDAVRSHLMSDVPYGVLISGGLDSSVIAALAARHAAMRVEDDERSPAWWPRLHSFAVGLVGSPDLAAAREVAAHIGTVHHEVVYTIEEGLDAVSDVIRHLETYDVTTIRAATPMYLMARRIKAMGIKMVLSGEGADEIFGGYLYFHKAPDAREFHAELLRKLEKLHLYDCLRANKAMAAWGVEARVPFLDKRFLDVAMTIAPGGQDVRRRDHREEGAPGVLRRPAARAGGLAPEGAVLRWRGLRLDRRPEGHGRGRGQRRGLRGAGGAFPGAHAGLEGGLPLPRPVRAALRRRRIGAAHRAPRQVGGLLDRGGAGLGRQPAEPQRSVGAGGGGARGGLPERRRAGFPLGQIEDQELGRVRSPRRLSRASSLTAAPSPWPSATPLRVTDPAGDLHPGMPPGCQLVGHRLAGLQDRRMHRHILVDAQRAVPPVGRDDQAAGGRACRPR